MNEIGLITNALVKGNAEQIPSQDLSKYAVSFDGSEKEMLSSMRFDDSFDENGDEILPK